MQRMKNNPVRLDKDDISNIFCRLHIKLILKDINFNVTAILRPADSIYYQNSLVETEG